MDKKAEEQKGLLNSGMTRREALQWGLIAGAGLASLSIPSFSSAAQAASSPPKYGGTLRIQGQDPLGWDPHKTFSYRTHLALNFVYGRALEFPAGPEHDPTDYTPIPGLVESWEQPNKTTYIFHVRKGVKFHNKPPVNGRELIADDIKYTIERMWEKKFTYRDLFALVSKMETPDRHTLKVTLKEPYVPFLSSMANHYVSILAKEVGEKYGDFVKPETAIGTGPFMLESYQPNVKSIFRRNPDYYKKWMPYVDTIEWMVMPDPSARLSALRSGNLDIDLAMAAPLIETVKRSNPELTFYDYVGVGGQVLYFNVNRKPFNDIRVRRAMALAFDRKAWLQAFYLGKGAIDNGPPVLAAQKEWKLPTAQLGPGARYFEYNLDEAKKLMKEAGYPNGFKSKLDGTAGYGPAIVDHMELVKDMMSKIGIEITLNLKEYADWAATGHAGIYEEMAYGPMTPYIEVDEWTYEMLHTGASANKCHCADPRLDELLKQQRRTFDKAERKKVLEQVQKHVADQVYYIYPPVGFTYAAWHPWVKNYRPHAGYLSGEVFRGVWLDKKA